MKYVLDSSVAFKWVVPEADTDKALRLRDDFHKGLHELLAPDVFAIEVIHGLTRAERQGRVTPPDGGLFWHDVMATAPQLFPSLPLIPRAYAIASAARVGVYDCLYIALAEREKSDFLAADDKLVKNLQKQFPFLVWTAKEAAERTGQGEEPPEAVPLPRGPVVPALTRQCGGPRPDRRLQLQRGGEPGPRSRFAGDDPAPAGRGTHAADVPLPGP